MQKTKLQNTSRFISNLLASNLMILLVAFGLSSTAVGQDSGGFIIKIGDAKLKKSLLAMPPFQFLSSPGGSKDYKVVGTELFNTVTNDLDVSSYFTFIKQEAFLENTAEVGLKPAPGEPGGFKFENWSKIGAEFLIRAGYTLVRDTLTLEAYVYYVPQAKLVFGKKYTGTKASLRRLAHTFANDILENLTGKPGMFLSRVVVASDKPTAKYKEIYTMDWDGHDLEKISNHRSIALSPNWSPDGKTIVYTAFAFHQKAKVHNADLFTYELDNEKRFLISSRKGINSGAAFLPDGKNLLVTISQAGNPDIFRMAADGDSLVRLTSGPAGAMNVEPAVSPDGKRIAFSSDRSGRPMIYTMDIDGGNVKRITFAGQYNSSPAWSPDGKKIAFAGQDKDHFDIFIMDADGMNLERLTSAKKPNGRWANNEDPCFSPDGRHVMFTSNRTGTNQIFIVNVDGTNERRITVDKFNYFRPKWR